MDDKKIQTLSEKINKLLETVTAINSKLYQYMDNYIDDYKEKSTELIKKEKVYLILSNLRESGVITQEQAYILSEEVRKLISR